MNRSDFDLLPEMDKLSMILEEGVLLTQHHQGACRHFLYRVFAFYVSVKYRDIADNLVDIISYDDPSELLSTYAETTKIKDPASRIQENPEK